MAKKRKHGDYAATDTSKAQVDPTYGQKSFFPGLDGSSDDDASAEAFAYLRSVRTEANGIPILLTAPQDASYISAGTVANSGGYYSDGAYVANAIESASVPEERTIDDQAMDFIEPQTVWHESLISRFRAYRAQLKPPVPEEVLSAFDTASNPVATDFGHPSSNGALEWKHILKTTVPKPTQLALMDQETVRWLLELMPYVAGRARWLQEDGKQGRCISAWVWGLLARLDELDTLSSEEVSVVRSLGKHAGTIIFGLDEQFSDGQIPQASTVRGDSSNDRMVRKPQAARRRRNSSSDEDEDEDEGQEVEPEEMTQEAHVHPPSEIEEGPVAGVADANLAKCTSEDALSGTLDMILTIIGECYGQRDLLVARDKLWTNGSNP